MLVGDVTASQAALIAGIVGGGSAILAAAIATFGTYKVTNRSIAADVTGRREERRQQRIEDAYIEIQTYLSRCIKYVNEVRVGIDVSVPRWDLARQAAAKLRSSSEVRPELNQFELGMLDVEEQVQQMVNNGSGAEGADYSASVKNALRESATLLSKMQNDLFELMSHELA